jgi:hypothetical protein
MEFFNKKEEVIDLQLTQFGRHLLSKGKFKPVYYSFHDDNILYNIELQNLREEQNNSQSRIEETPTMKAQISFSSLEKEFLKNYNKVLSGQEKTGGKSQQPTAIKNYALPQPIGTSDINKENAPAMSVHFLKGKLESMTSSLTLTADAGKNTLKIPQLESELEIEYIPTDVTDFYETEDPGAIVGVVTREEDTYFIIKLNEENAPFQKKNFDIEVFDIVQDKDDAGNNTTETLRPLEFIKNQPFDKEFDFINISQPPLTQGNVAYYFDLLADDEINEKIICDLDVDMTKKGVFIDKKLKNCKILEEEERKKVFDIYEPETDDPGEVC